MCGSEGYDQFLKVHESQIVNSGIPGVFLPALFYKLKNEIFDAGETFQIVKSDEVPCRTKVIVITENGVNTKDGYQIYLIDHAWVFESHKARHHLSTIPGLMERMKKLMDLDCSDTDIDLVESELWKYNQTFTVVSEESIEKQLPLYYVMDEFGSAIQHSDDPNFETVPFIFAPNGVSFTILFPLKDVSYGEEVCRDYVSGIKDRLLRKALMLPWEPNSFRDIDYHHVQVNEEYFLRGRTVDTLPIESDCPNEILSDDRKYTVYSEYKLINDRLDHPRFEIVYNPNVADILWYTSNFADFRKLSIEAPNKFINQFPHENVITVKDLLSAVCRCSMESGAEGLFDPIWLPTTYNLKTELPQFISYFQLRDHLGLDNFWICKPWNLARGLDTLITNNINCIIRLSTSGPKIAQKYIVNPLLFYRQGIGKVKFDIRYVLLLKSVQPLKAYVYKNFFLRFANKPFELKDLTDYEKHFTVMNYNEGVALFKMLCSDFIKEFESQYPQFEWSSVEAKIMIMLKRMLMLACSRKPPCGISPNRQSRALYAVDIMLAQNRINEIVPKLLEVNWLPDCKRACEYYPNFINDVFSLLFLNDANENMYQL